MGRIHHTPPGGSEEICFYLIFSLILLVFGPAGLPLLLLDWSGPARRFSLGLRQVFRFFLFDGSRPQGPSPRGGSGPVARVQLAAPGGSCLKALGSQGAPTRGCSFPTGSMGLACSPRSHLTPTLRPLPAGAPCPSGLWPSTPGRLVSPSLRGSSGGPLAPVAPPARRPAPPCWAAWHSFS